MTLVGRWFLPTNSAGASDLCGVCNSVIFESKDKIQSHKTDSCRIFEKFTVNMEAQVPPKEAILGKMCPFGVIFVLHYIVRK
jgi:hypothetical protein